MDKPGVNQELLKKIFIVFLAFVGFLTTIKLAIVYYDANFDQYSLPSFCSVNNFIDCDGVAKTTHAQFFGVPLAYWGMFLYIFIIFLCFVDKLKNYSYLKFLEVFKNPLAYISVLGLVSFFISMILAAISIFEIKKICILCVFTYFLNLFIALIATDYKTGVVEGFKVSVIDFIDALKVKKYLISFISISLITAVFLTYTSLSYCFTPQVKRYKSISEFAKMKSNPFKASGNVLGDPNAKLVVEFYSDYECPICYSTNLMVYRSAQELSGVKFVHYNLPLDSECNPKVIHSFHENSCKMARYALASKSQGRFWDFNSELFEKQPKTDQAILKVAQSMGLDTKKLQEEANSFSTSQQLSEEINRANELRIGGTPAMVINGKVYEGIKPYYELKEILIKAGAVEKR